jgi:hypothetical protein
MANEEKELSTGVPVSRGEEAGGGQGEELTRSEEKGHTVDGEKDVNPVLS